MCYKNSNETSLILQFDISSDISTTKTIDVVKELFKEFGYNIKKIYYSYRNRIYSPSISKFCEQFESIKSNIKSISFQSNYDKYHFEPNVEMDIELNYRYIETKKDIKCSIILNNGNINLESMETYKRIINIMVKNMDCEVSGYSFYLENIYSPISFSSGILRRSDIPVELKWLANFYHYSDAHRTTLGLYNCFSYLDLNQISLLKSIFGKDNVITIKHITLFYNKKYMEYVSLKNYINSSKLKDLAARLSNELYYDVSSFKD